jgi:hypothetical protein
MEPNEVKPNQMRLNQIEPTHIERETNPNKNQIKPKERERHISNKQSEQPKRNPINSNRKLTINRI